MDADGDLGHCPPTSNQDTVKREWKTKPNRPDDTRISRSNESRVAKQPRPPTRQVNHVLPDKFRRVPRQGFTCFETTIDVSPDNYTRVLRIVSQAYDSRTKRNR